jgi:hypothetical protein
VCLSYGSAMTACESGPTSTAFPSGVVEIERGPQFVTDRGEQWDAISSQVAGWIPAQQDPQSRTGGCIWRRRASRRPPMWRRPIRPVPRAKAPRCAVMETPPRSAQVDRGGVPSGA